LKGYGIDDAQRVLALDVKEKGNSANTCYLNKEGQLKTFQVSTH
jgi:hypothetical protein